MLTRVAAMAAVVMFSAATCAKGADGNASATAASGRGTLCAAVRECVARLDAGMACDVLPVPERSLIPMIPDRAPVEVRPLREGVWLYRDFGVMSLILRHKARLVLLDLPDSESGSNKPDGSRTRLTDASLAILNGTVPRRIDLVYSHIHFDHIGASRLYVQWARRVFPDAQINIYGSSAVAHTIAQSISKRAVRPTVIVRPGMRRTLRLSASLRVTMDILGGHAGRDIALHIPRSGSQPAILMFVDVVFPRWSPFHALAITEDVARYISVHDDLLKYDFDVFVGGHLRTGDRNDVSDNLRFVKDLFRTAQEARQSITIEERAAEGIFNVFTPGTLEYSNAWVAAIKAGRALEARKCARNMIEKWGCYLGGAAITMFDHCFTVLSYQFVAG